MNRQISQSTLGTAARQRRGSENRASSGDMLQHVNVRRRAVPSTDLQLHSPQSQPNPSCLALQTSYGYPTYVHQRTTVTSVTTETLFIAATTPPVLHSLPGSPPFWSHPGHPDHPAASASSQYAYGEVPQQPYGFPSGGPDGGDDDWPQTMAQKRAQNFHVVRLIESVFLKVFKQLGAKIIPTIQFELLGENWNHFELREDGRLQLKPEGIQKKTVSLAMTQATTRFVSILKLLGRIKILLLADTYANKRELFYENVKLFGSQGTVNSALDTITLILKVPRHSLNVTASSKGLVAGHLIFRTEAGVEIDCLQTTSGIPVPTAVQDVEILHSNAKIIFIIEKDSSFQSLREDDICWMTDTPCIMITAKGYPDEATRYFLMKLVAKLNIPVLAITDGDPHGIDIMCMYRYGTKAPHFGNLSLAVPRVRWLGVMPSDVQKYLPDLVEGSFVALTQKDRELAYDILCRPYCLPPLRREVEIMLQQDGKLEIQNVSALAPRFFVDVYLRAKLKKQDWI